MNPRVARRPGSGPHLRDCSSAPVANQLRVQLRPLLELIQQDPLVSRVRLCDVAGTKHDQVSHACQRSAVGPVADCLTSLAPRQLQYLAHELRIGVRMQGLPRPK